MRFKRGKAIILSILLMLLIMPLSGQVLSMRFSEPFDESLLTSNLASCITQDSMGFIWIGTTDGLNCFNGSSVTQYKYNYKDSASLVNNTISTLYVDHSGRIWIGTHLGTCIYNPLYDNFNILSSEGNYNGLESVQINTITQDSNNNIYVSAGNSIYKFDEDFHGFKLIYSIEQGNINKFIFDEKDNIWIGVSDDGGVIYLDTRKNEPTKYFNTESKNNISNNTIRDLAIFNNKLWIATYGGGVNSIDLNTDKIKHYTPIDQYAGFITNLYVDNDNNLWTCDHTGLKLYDKENDSFFGYYTIEGDDKSIKNSAVDIFQDRQKNYWTIHAPGGVSIRTAPKGFYLYDKNPFYEWRTSDNNISTIGFDKEGNWWVGNGFNGIDVFNWSEGYVQTFNDDPDNPYSLGRGGILSIFKDRDNRMWIGTNLGGLQYYNKTENRFYSYVNDPENPATIANNDIRSIVQDKEGNLWVSVHGKGIDKFDINNKTFQHFTNAKNGLANDWTFQLLIDKDETLWAATAWGLSKLTKGANEFQSYYNNSVDSNTLCNNQVNCLFEDSDGLIWIGTSSGLNKYNPVDDNFTRVDSGFANNYILSIVGEKENLWISTQNGISKYNKTTGYIYNFDEQDGLIEGLYHPRSAAKNSEGKIFFGGDGGLTVFDPRKIKLNNEIPDVYITELRILNQPIINYGKESVLERKILYTEKITLKHYQNAIGFSFVSNNLVNFNKNKYKYKLEGIDIDWVDSGNKNFANYPHLHPGKYTFKVIASNNDDVWNETGASLEIRILYPWYNTLLARIIYAFIIFAFILLIFYFRTASLKQRNNWLTQKVEERTQRLFEKNKLLKQKAEELKNANTILKNRQEIIVQQKDELKSQGEELKVTAENLEEINRELTISNNTKDKLFSIIGHDLRNPFNVILGYSDLLIENLEDWDDDQKLEMLLLLKESSSGAYSLLDNLLNWSRSQSGAIEYFPENLAVEELVENVLVEILPFAGRKDISIKPSIEKDLSLQADLNMLKLICRNILMNAIKFSHSGSEILIEIKKVKNNYVQFSVADHGIGMSQQQIDSLFNFDDTLSTQGTSGEKGTGLGLMLCHEFILLHKGSIWVKSKPDKGTTFYFTIPEKSA